MTEKQTRSPWTLQQQLRQEEIIEDHERRGLNAVYWSNYAAELGHPVNSCYVAAKAARARIEARRRTDYRQKVKEALDAADLANGPLPVMAREAPSSPRQVLDGERVSTSTHAYLFAAEMRSRIGSQGITAGLLGDPPPGRSALDEKRGTTIEAVTVSRKRMGRETRMPSVATRLDRDLR